MSLKERRWVRKLESVEDEERRSEEEGRCSPGFIIVSYQRRASWEPRDAFTDLIKITGEGGAGLIGRQKERTGKV